MILKSLIGDTEIGRTFSSVQLCVLIDGVLKRLRNIFSDNSPELERVSIALSHEH